MTEGATKRGFHFLKAWTECQRKFLYTKVWGYTPKGTSVALVLGKATHKFKELFYKSGLVTVSIEGSIEAELQPAELEEEGKGEVRRRLNASCEKWVVECGDKDLVRFEILGVEEEFCERLGTNEQDGSPLYLTGRRDARVRDRETGIQYTLETKTTGGPAKKMLEDTVHSGQIDAYQWADVVSAPKGTPIGGVIVDVLRSSDNKGGVAVECLRSDPITRTLASLRDFEKRAMLIERAIERAIWLLSEGEDSFIPNWSACSGMVPCPFRSVCRSLKPADPTLQQFTIEPSEVEFPGFGKQEVRDGY